MNGIIHQCSHPNDEDVHFRISEEKIFADIFHYLEVLFRIIKPRKVFFMAVDGVAPRAKMNQQRGRRFRSAKEAEDKIKKALEKGEVLPSEARFDSNCITPGTDFMARLQEQLKYFVNSKVSTDNAWKGVNVYLSGHETPGEGEHKIMEFIRWENTKPDHDPNTRHCLYGLDADLMMLGLTSHEPHFSLLREEVRFGGKKNQKRITAPEETTFHLLHLSLFREYIDYEFSEVKNKISFEYDLERIIDDWILMGFLVGNDFIPHLPHLHINHDALPLLYRTYISVLPTLGGYLNENGHLNLGNFEKYLEKLSEFDREHFNEVFVDLKWFESKVGNKYLNEAAGLAAEEAHCKDSRKKDLEDGEEEDMFEAEFRQYKRTYYMTKMGVEVVSDEFLANQALCYVEGIQWILHYYYHGVQSWSWYYPHHYAPFLSDVRNIAHLKLTFDMGKPFMPFQQLLGVLPSASKDLLPQSYRHLMTSENSSIIEYYPLDFKTDLNGKQQEWEAVVLIPFIDERCLLAAMEPYNDHMTKAEKARNRHTQCAVYSYDAELDYLSTSTLPDLFPNIMHCHVRVTPVPMDAWHVSLSHVGRSINSSQLYFCGFPTLKHIRHKFYKKKHGVVVFQQSSRGENMMLEIIPSKEEPVCDNVASLVLGRSVFVNWPHLEEARVVAVSDGESKFFLEELAGMQKLYDRDSPPPTKVTYLSDKEQKDWVKDVQGITEHFGKRKGITVNETAVVLYTQLLTGRKYVPGQSGQVHLEKQWAKQTLPFPYQTIVKDIKAFDSSSTRFKTLEELFPPTTTVFMVGNPYYGAMGEVGTTFDVIKEGRVRVVFSVPCEPPMESLIQNQHKYCVKYSPGYVLASRLGITGYLVSRFSGSIFVGRGSKKNPHGEQKANVGLNLKFNKKNEEVPGYTKRTEKEWLYSVAVEDLMAEYLDRCVFSEVFDLVSRNSHDDVFYEDDIWPGVDQNGAERVKEITSWLKTHPVADIARASCDLQILDTAIVEQIEEEVAKVKKSTKKVRVTVKPHLLFRPLEQQHGVVPDPDAEYHLFDRVVNVRESFSVPLGLRGTIIGIKGADREAEVLYEVVFDEEFAGGLTIRCASGRGYRLPPCALINLSHGCRFEQGSHKLTAIVKPQPAASSHHSHNKEQLSGLNHSPRSPFIPTQFFSTMPHFSVVECVTSISLWVQGKDEEFSNVWQSLQSSGLPQKPPAHWQQNNVSPFISVSVPGPAGSIRLLKRNEDVNTLFPAQNATKKFEELIANLKITKGNEPTSQSEEPLSPQSFAMVGTRLVQSLVGVILWCTQGPHQTLQLHLSTHSLWFPSSMCPSVASELARICIGLGMAPPDFTFIRSRQGLMVCQVKLSSGLLVHGPQSHSENEAKEKAALFALQRLNSVGSGFPMPPPLFSGVGQIRGPPMGPMPNVFGQSGGLLIPPQGYGPLHWGMPLPPHQGQPFYGGTFPGARPQAPSVPIGSHNQFVPLQVGAPEPVSTGHTRTCFYGSHQNLFLRVTPEPVSMVHIKYGSTQPSHGHTPSSASKRKHRKLAVNFEVAKVQE
uniref:5'-3' exoribonuclease 1 n=1 Tax=Salmo trutta TaxID=8032 RepID=A0A674DJ02_SALTR